MTVRSVKNFGLLLLVGGSLAGVANLARAMTGEYCTTTNGTCTVTDFTQDAAGNVLTWVATVTNQTTSARVTVFDAADNEIDQISMPDPGATGASCHAWHSCGLWGVPIWCGEYGSAVGCESTGSGVNGAIACQFNNGGGDAGTTFVQCCTYNGGC